MRVPPLVHLTPVLALVFVAQTLSQSIETFPPCWQDCLKSSDLGCKDTDLNCLSLIYPSFFFPGSPTSIVILETPQRLTNSSGICSSASSHISSLVACVTSKCSSASLTPLQVGCQLSSPIPSSLLSSVKSITTDVAHPTLLLASPTSLTVIHTSTAAGSAASATATGKKDDGGGQGGGDGTVLDLEGRGGKREGACLLGLTVGILAGIAWF